MDSLVSQDKAEAKKKGMFAAATWGGAVAAGLLSGPFLAVPVAGFAGYLTWKWFVFRAKRGMRF